MARLSFCISLITFLLYFSILLISCFAEKTEALGSRYHSVDVTSLLAASACTRQASSDSNTRKHSTTLEVVDIHGPCSPHPTQNKPSLADILSHDQSRVDSIHARLNHNSSLLQNQYKYNRVPQRYYNYVVTIGLGTPPQNVTLAFDTVSSLSWTQCKPCFGHCYKQWGPVYNPLSSCTYSSISCNSAQCSELGLNKFCYAGPCVYNSIYENGSYSVGAVSKERLTIRQTTNDVFHDFIFGCGQKNRGLFGEASGILGLNRNSNMSFVYQTKRKYKQCFSYCIPSTASSTGLLAFGGNKCSNAASNVRFTPLTPDPYFYLIEIVAISVGGARLPIKPSVFKNPGTVVESGAVITRLPRDAYVVMRDAFRKSVSYPTAPAYSLFDTCYDITDLRRIENVPAVSFTFSGGVNVEIDFHGVLYFVDSTLMCLAFAGNNDSNDFAVFGSYQQRTFEMVYDVAGGRLGFGPGGCK